MKRMNGKQAWTLTLTLPLLGVLSIGIIGIAAAQTPPPQRKPAQTAQQPATAADPAQRMSAEAGAMPAQAQGTDKAAPSAPARAASPPPDTRKPAVAFREECGACHIPYPARLLPRASWDALMNNLADHFGEDATLAEDTAAKVRGYLLSHAARWRVRKNAKPPLRITKLRWFVREHRHEVSPRRLKKAGSWSNCASCHRGAARGRFGDD